MLARGDQFLAGLSDPRRARLSAADVAVVVAHPDDETIGCGALLARLDGARIILVTDGAPRNLMDARAHGFDTASAYAVTRRREIEAALAVSAVPTTALVALGVPDQQAALRLEEIAYRLVGLFRERGTHVVLTHAYEGGHPDHDAMAFAVHAAAGLLAREGHALAIVEMPFYRLDDTREVNQRFAPHPDVLETVVALTPQEQACKRRMIAAHATQAAVLAVFTVDAERFRPAPGYDFARLPNDGRLLYEGRPWGMTGARWRVLAGAALAKLASTP